MNINTLNAHQSSLLNTNNAELKNNPNAANTANQQDTTNTSATSPQDTLNLSTQGYELAKATNTANPTVPTINTLEQAKQLSAQIVASLQNNPQQGLAAYGKVNGGLLGSLQG